MRKFVAKIEFDTSEDARSIEVGASNSITQKDPGASVKQRQARNRPNSLDIGTVELLVALSSSTVLSACINQLIGYLRDRGKKAPIKITIGADTIEFSAGTPESEVTRYIAVVKKALRDD